MDLNEEELKATREMKAINKIVAGDEKKCEYCKEDEYFFENFEQDNKHKEIIYHPTSSWEGTKKLKINYCPMCGRKLV